MTRRLPLALCGLALVAGCTHAAVTMPDALPVRDGVEIFEDGSGVQWLEGERLRVFDEGTFVWDCSRMGNRQCGPVR